MKLKLTSLLTLLTAFVMQFSFAQQKTVSGTITDDSNLPLPGVNIIVKNTSKGVQTDFDGNYSINVSSGEVLVFTYQGFKKVEKTVGASNTISFAMVVDAAELQEVVIIADVKRSKVTSTVAEQTVTASTIENRPNASLVQTLQGQVAGLNINTSTGQPGGNSDVRLRGTSSINGNNEPLFIIDGAPVDEDNFRSLNPQDVASVTVLKDAAATAIYGNRGANGVIVIKTRGGNFEQPLRINYSGFVAYSNLQDNDYNAMTSQELLTYERFRGNGAGAGNSSGVFNPGAGTPLTDAQIGAAPNFNWTDFFFRTGVTQNHTVSLSSGGKNSAQFTSFGFNDTEGILQDSDLKRFNIRSNVNGKSDNDRFTYGTNLTLNYSKSNEPNSIGSGAINRNYVLGAFISVPYITADDYTNGAALLSPLSFTNTPLFLLDRLNTYTRFEEEVKIVGSANFGYEITDWLRAGVTMSMDYQSESLTRAEGPESFNALLFGGAENPTSGFQQQFSTRAFTYNQITSLNASKTFGKHTFDLGLFTEYSKSHFRQFGYFANGLSPQTFYPGDGSGLVAQTGGLFNDEASAEILNIGLFSYFGTFDYDFDQRYGFSASYRRDASSRFAQSNRWGDFYSVSARWNISNEAFMQGSAINNLKLRVSYGTAGNQRITGTFFGGPDLTENFFTTAGGYGNNPAIVLSQFGNSDLRWETITTANIGIDFGVWNNRLRGSFDVYERETSDLYQFKPLSATVGTTGQNANTGLLYNRGFDFNIAYDVFQRKTENSFGMTAEFVGGYNKTELQEVPSPDGEIIGIGRNGGKLGEYFTLRYAGINPANGNLLYYTADGNITENPDPDNDRVWIDKNILPNFQGSVNLNFDYKNFFLTTQWYGVFGVDRFDNDYADLIDPTAVGQFNLSTDLFRAWSQPGDVTDIPSPTASNLNSFGDSDRFLRSADFVRLRLLSFGYNFPEKYLDGTGFSQARIFFNAENALTFTEWRGFDPETRDNGSRQYPTPKTFSIGFELQF